MLHLFLHPNNHMTDLEKLESLLKDWGVGFKRTKEENVSNEDVIRCSEGSAKIDGYADFFTEFFFDKDGKFLRMGAWE